MKLETLIKRDRVRCEVEWADRNPNMVADEEWSRSANHYRCTLRRKGRQLTVPFSMGSAHCKEPEALDLLECLLSDYMTVEQARSFEEWARELGFDEDSRKAERSYKVTVRQSEKLAQFLGSDIDEYCEAER